MTPSILLPARDLMWAAVAIPWLGVVLGSVWRRHARLLGCITTAMAGLACGLLLWQSPKGGSLYDTLALLYTCLSFAALVVLPRRDCTWSNISGILFLLGCTLLAYWTNNLLILVAAWMLSSVPFMAVAWLGSRSWRPRAGLLISSLCLAVALTWIWVRDRTLAISALQGHAFAGAIVFWLFVLAVIFRKAMVPGHAWIPDMAETTSAIPASLLLNEHFGALLIIKLLVPLDPHAGARFPIFADFALWAALYFALRALSENSPRRLLALLTISQSACILSGLESGTAAGISGALAQWIVVSVTTVGLFAILRLLEVRFGGHFTVHRHYGLAEHSPRLAVFFAIFALAFIGLPGTLGFCSQDLLIHGALQSHPWIGLLLPITAAMNAISMFRLFTRLFLGKRRTGITVMADALPCERWALTAGVLFVVLGGLFPNAILMQPSAGLSGKLSPRIRMVKRPEGKNKFRLKAPSASPVLGRPAQKFRSQDLTRGETSSPNQMINADKSRA